MLSISPVVKFAVKRYSAQPTLQFCDCFLKDNQLTFIEGRNTVKKITLVENKIPKYGRRKINLSIGVGTYNSNICLLNKNVVSYADYSVVRDKHSGVRDKPSGVMHPKNIGCLKWLTVWYNNNRCQHVCTDVLVTQVYAKVNTHTIGVTLAQTSVNAYLCDQGPHFFTLEKTYVPKTNKSGIIIAKSVKLEHRGQCALPVGVFVFMHNDRRSVKWMIVSIK
jgi:hypothetical protein